MTSASASTASASPCVAPAVLPARALNTSLFAATPNTSGVYDFTLSDEDELARGLPRLLTRRVSALPNTTNPAPIVSSG